MAKNKRKSNTEPTENITENENHVSQEIITDTLEKNYMPYAMSVIISRAIPQIDGFKPAHRKLLYTMFKMNLLSKSANRTKSANIVGQTMRLNPHGDAAIYETLVRLTRGNEALLHPFIDSKGSFGKQYSKDMAYAAARYTECKLDEICTEIFNGIDRNCVDFVENYDNTMQEPVLLPTAFPNILVSPNQGVAVGMASTICSFNMSEICDTTIKIIKNPDITTDEILKTLKAPDFSTGGQIIYNEEVLKEIYETGRGSFKLRARYNYNKSENCIEIHQIPYTATIEAVMDKIESLVKEGKIRDISDIRDETDIGGLKITIDLKRGVDYEKLMAKLFKMTPLEDSFSCNFNVLVGATPTVMGVKEILNEWILFRTECVRRECVCELTGKQSRLHLLNGLKALILDIDKAVKIIRETEKDANVVPNLMDGFRIDEIQAEFVAEIKLRNINKEYLLSKIKETESLVAEIKKLDDILNSEIKLKNLIVKQLENIKKKFGKPRLTEIIYSDDIVHIDTTEDVPEFNVFVVMTKDGYFKKITLQSLRGNDEQKIKEGDEIILKKEVSNNSDALFFTDKGQVYKYKISDFENQKASALGEFIPAKLGFDKDERVIFTTITDKYQGSIIFIFENGKAARIPLASYETKTNRKKLSNAYSMNSPLVGGLNIDDSESDVYIACIMSDGRVSAINTKLIPEKTTRTTIGVDTFYLTKKPKPQKIKEIIELTSKDTLDKYAKCIKTSLPARSTNVKSEDLLKNQVTLDIE